MASGTAHATLPWSWYSDPDVLRLEQERVSRRGWRYAGPAVRVAEPGAYMTCEAGDVPVVVVRGRDEQLRARGLVESVQRGVRSGLLDAGGLMPESEKVVAQFQALMGEALA